MFTRFFFYFDSPPFSLPATDNGVLYTVPKLRVLILHLFSFSNNCSYSVKITVVLVFPIIVVKAKTRTLNPFNPLGMAATTPYSLRG